MKQTLLLLIIAGMVGCKDDDYDKRGHSPLSKAHYYEEKAIMFTIQYYKEHGYYPSYYIRQWYYEYKDDKEFIDSLIYKTPDIENFRGEEYSEDTIRAEDLRGSFVADSSFVINFDSNYWGICDSSPVFIPSWCNSCPHIIKDSVRKPTGNIKFTGDNGNFVGNATYSLGVDSLGNIIEDTCRHINVDLPNVYWSGDTLVYNPKMLSKKDSLP